MEGITDKHIELIVTNQAMDAHKRGFLTNYNMDDGVKSGQKIADAQLKSCEKQHLKEMIEWGDDICYEHSIGLMTSRKRCVNCWQSLRDRLKELKKCPKY